MRVALVILAVLATLAVGCGTDGPTAIVAPVEGPLTLEYVKGSARYEVRTNGDDNYSTYIVRDGLGRAVSGAMIRWRVAYDGAPDTVTSDTSNIQGRWTLHWFFSPQYGTTRVLACATNPEDDCEPSQELEKVTVTVDSISPNRTLHLGTGLP